MTNLRMIALFREIAKILACVAACLGWLSVLFFPVLLIFTSFSNKLEINNDLNKFFGDFDFGTLISSLTTKASNLDMNFIIGIFVLPLFMLISGFVVYKVFPKKYWLKRIHLTEPTFFFPIVTAAICVFCILITTIISIPEVASAFGPLKDGILYPVESFNPLFKTFYYIPYILLIGAAVLLFLSSPIQGAKLDEAMIEYVTKMDQKGMKKKSEHKLANGAAVAPVVSTPDNKNKASLNAIAVPVTTTKTIDKPDVVIDMIDQKPSTVTKTKTIINKKAKIVINLGEQKATTSSAKKPVIVVKKSAVPAAKKPVIVVKKAK